MKAIVVVDKNWAIGKNGSLLIHLPGDLKHFKEKTRGKVVVMGRSTLESLPGGKPLPDRTNIVLSRNPYYKADCTVCCSQDSLLRELEQYDTDDVYIIGGEQIYRCFLPYCDTAYITKIDTEFKADRFFENLDKRDNWKLVNKGEPKYEQGVYYSFTEYKRNE
ncbi:MAG: dihydrofolate reductase [Eubacteriales bacterium]|nr:dihydrofolate reductase [Eubacteriales bacterium]